MPTGILRFALALIAGGILLRPASGRAQSVRWDPAGGTLAVGETTALQMVFTDCEPKLTPKPPAVDGLRIQYSSQSSDFSEIDGAITRTLTLTYAVLLNAKQAIEIPAFAVETDKGRLTVPAVRFEPTGATVGSTGKPLESAASATLEGPPAAVWAGEVFRLNYEIGADRSYYPDFGSGALDWNARPAVAEDWSQPQPYSLVTDTGPRTGRAYRARALIRAPGSYRLNPVSQIVNLSVGVTGFGFFQQRQYQQFSVTSNRPTIEVRPLPPAPAGFSGAVGSFKLTSKVVPSTAAIGTPITWTLELSGTGNWPDIAGLPARSVSQDFQVIQPQPRRALAAGRIFDGTLSGDAVLIPTKPGVYTLDPVAFVYFDPRAGTYQTIAIPAATVTVTGAAGAGSPAAPLVALPSAAAPVPTPESPSGLPRDALPAAGSAPAPLSGGDGLAWAAAPFGLALLGWFALALRRARISDPGRPRREAGRRLAAALGRWRQSAPPESQLPALLRSWQRDTAILWGVAHAAPTARQFSAPPPPWSDLWAEADRALYGADSVLPSDWAKRAAEALAAAKLPAFKSRRLLFRQNLLPWFFCAAIAAVTAAGPLRAETASALYWGGDFSGAEQAFHAALAQNPADWSARHNLSLALAQQGRWDEAAAYAAGAFVQQPGSESVRWQFALACQKAGFAPAPLAAFLSPGFAEDLAVWASPAVWQRILAAAAWLAAAALALLLFRGYRVVSGRWPLPTAFGALALALVLGAAAAAGWRAYGIAADPRAVIIWRNSTLRSVPTEVEAGQQTEPLPAGSMAVADRDFLGWERLVFENGQTGWVRRGEAASLWR